MNTSSAGSSLGRPVVTQEWSLHAELTFCHEGAGAGGGQGRGVAGGSDSGAHTACSWGSPAPAPAPAPAPTPAPTPAHAPAPAPAPAPCYGFQRGSILFTTTPPARTTPRPYGRRCKSTCSIVLAGAPEPTGAWPGPAPVPPAPSEGCEVCGGGRSPTAARRAACSNTFTTHFCTRLPARAHSFGGKGSKDAAIQTCEEQPVRRGHSLQVPPTPTQATPTPRKKLAKKLTRSAAQVRGKSPLLHKSPNSATGSRASSPETGRKPRTVHIDVYCTGSEDADADASELSDSPEEGESWSSPQTVFESDKLRVVHTRAGKNQLPHALLNKPGSITLDGASRSQSFKSDSTSKADHSSRGFDSDDGLSSHYPSKQSSYTAFQDTDSSLNRETPPASRDPSTSTISSSSCAIFGDEYDSAVATSWKDTATELDSLVQSCASLAQSDSFEYADALDRLRIREKERAWAGTGAGAGAMPGAAPSPQPQSKQLLRQQKLREFLQKHVGAEGFPLWRPGPGDPAADDSDEDDADDTGDVWSIGGGADGKRKRDSDKPGPADTGSLSDSGSATKHKFTTRPCIGPFGSRPPSPPPAKLESCATSPFTLGLGGGTDHLLRAQKFGTIVGALRKPGHHVGPARNPDCGCQHCRQHYGHGGQRGRARSVGEVALGQQLGSN